MKTVSKIVGVVVIVLLLVLLVLRFTGFSPIGNAPGPGNYPGLWLRGNVVTTPVADWSFATQYETDQLQTRTWYVVPHSVTTGFVVYNGQLYLTSIFGAGVPFPQGKSWVANVMRDPHVRVKLGSNLYDCFLSLVTDPNEGAAVLAARARQSPGALSAGSGSPGDPTMHLFRAVSD
jgi:hypothetical protein